MSNVQTVLVGGIEVARITRADLVKNMIEDCVRIGNSESSCKLIFDLNGHGVALARRSEDFAASLNKADLIHADGQPIVAASRLLTRAPIPERSATTDFFHDASEAASRVGLRSYYLGGSERVSEDCEAKMKEFYPGLIIAGRRNGYFSEEEEAEICEEINSLSVDLLWVGLGKPLEQAFCVRNKHRLKVGWVITCGGCFNYVTGGYPRAPAWMQKFGMEWVHRMATGPRRLIWRYVSTNPVALYMLLMHTKAIRAQ